MRITAGALAMVLALGAVAQGKQDLVKDAEGKAFAVILDCNSCKNGTGKNCESGKETGFDGSAGCGRCLLEANYGARILHAQDLTIVGTLKDDKGEPIVGRYVKIFLSSNVGVRTRTLNDGKFIMRIGATLQRKDKKPLLVDLGTRTIPKDSKAEQYNLYMMPEVYKPCGSKPEAEKPAEKPAAPPAGQDRSKEAKKEAAPAGDRQAPKAGGK